ncbi:MAG: GNAT family N-acetyltransferase [Desulfatibacillaceae bacterium]
MSGKWKARPYRAEDVDSIIRLRFSVFGNIDPVRTMPAAWKWWYLDNPGGHGEIWVAESDGQVVGHYAAIPTRMWVDGKPDLYAYSCDTMVHPSHRRQGVFTGLAKKCYARLEEDRGIKWIWGFPNEKSMPGFTRELGWHNMGRFDSWIMPVSPFAGSRAAPESNVPGVAGARVFPITRFDRDYDTLWERFAPDTGVCQVRDAAYLNWRYLGMDAFGYAPFAVFDENGLAGWFVLRKLKVHGIHTCVVLDMFPLPVGDAELARSVFAWIRRHAAREGMGVVATALFPRKSQPLAKRCGFYRTPRLLAPKAINLGCRPKDGPWSNVRAGQWRISYGDTDFV